MVANNNDTAAAGRHFERWARVDYDGLTIAEDIAALAAVGDRGGTALVHGGEPCDPEALALSLSAFLVGAGENAYFACTDGWLVEQGWAPTQRLAEYDYPLGPPLGPMRHRRVTLPRPDKLVRPSPARGPEIWRRGLQGVEAGMGSLYTREFLSGTNVSLLLPDGSTSVGQGCVRWSNGKVTQGKAGCPRI